MWRRIFSILGVGVITGIIGTTTTYSQVKKQFSVENVKSVEKVVFKFKSNSGVCYIKSGDSGDILNVYGNQDVDSYSHSFDKAVNKEYCTIDLNLEDHKSEGLGQSISYRMFGGSEEKSDKLWKVLLAKDKSYDLNLKYGIGMAKIDLSGLAISNLKVHTGSADVHVDYSSTSNAVEMDTFYVKVDMGEVKVNKLNMSRSKNVIADVGFGNLMLDFSDDTTHPSQVRGRVGAGNLFIKLPSDEFPVKVQVKNSWLCSVSLTKAFKSIGNNTYVNQAYLDNEENVLFFDLDVGMGSIVFKEN